MIDSLTILSSNLASALLNGLWQSLIIAGVVAVFLSVRSVRKQVNATTTYAVVLAAFWAVVGLHIVAIAGMNASETFQSSFELATPSAISFSDDEAAILTNLETTSQAATQTPTQTADSKALTSTQSSRKAASAIAPSGSALSTNETSLQQTTRIVPVLMSKSIAPIVTVLAGVWLLVATLLLARLVMSVVTILRVRNSSIRIPEYEAKVRVWQRASFFTREVSVASHPSISIPFVVGLGQPTILLPSDYEFEIDEAQIDQILLHELAHLQRYDDWTLLLQRTAEAVFFFNPIVRWLGNHLVSFREMACDERVVSKTMKPESYVSSLGRIAEIQLCRRTTLATAGMAVKKNSLLDRIKHILDNPSLVTDRFGKEEFAIACAILTLGVVTVTMALPAISISIGDHQEQDSVYAFAADIPPIPPVPPVPPIPPIPDIPAIAPLPPMPPIPKLADLPDLPELPELAPLASTPAAFPDAPGSPASLNPTNAPDLSASSWVKLLRTTKSISSSGDRSRVLSDAAVRIPDVRAVYLAYLDTVADVPSSSDRRRAITALTSRSDITELPWSELFATIAKLQAESDRAAALRQLAPMVPAAQFDAFRDAASTIRSSSLRERATSSISSQK